MALAQLLDHLPGEADARIRDIKELDRLGFPISTTHVVSGSVLGAGAVQRLSAVRWGLAGNIVVAWIITLPAAGAIAALCWFPVKWIF